MNTEGRSHLFGHKLLPSAMTTLSVLMLLLALAGCGRTAAHYLDEGNRLFAQARYADADLNYRKAVQKQPSLGEAYYRLGLSLLKEGRTLEAYQAFQQATDAVPTLNDAKVRQADLLLNNYFRHGTSHDQTYYRVKGLVADVLAKDPGCVDCLRMRGYLELTDGQTTEALATFRKADAIRPMQPDVVRGIIAALSRTQHREEAEKIALGLIAAVKTDGLAYDDLYALYQLDGRSEDAERVFQLKIANNPTVVAYRLQLAAHYYNNKKEPEMNATLKPLRDNPKAFPSALIEIAKFYMRLAKWAEARAALEDEVKQVPSEKLLARKLEVKAFAGEGRVDEAQRMTEDLVKEFPSDSEARLARVTFWLDSKNKGKAAEAAQELEKIHDERGNQPVYWYAAGRAQAMLGDMTKAEAAYHHAANLDPAYEPARVSLAELYLDQGKMTDAIRYSEEALQIQPTDGRARLIRAAAMMKSDRLPQATSELALLVKYNPRLADAKLELAMADIAQKRYAEAESLLSSLYHPGNPDLRALTGLVQIAITQGRSQQALDLLNGDLRRQTSNANGVRRLIARADLGAKQPDAAIQQYSEIAKTEPKRTVDDCNLLALAHQAKGDVAAALADMLEAERVAPANPDVISSVANLLQQTGRNEEALTRMRHLLQLKPDDTNTMNNIAFLLSEIGGNQDEALRFAQNALLKSPGNPWYADTVGLIYVKKKMPEKALPPLRAAVTRVPDNPQFLYHLGLAQQLSGDRSQASVTLKAALTKRPDRSDDVRIRELLSRLEQSRN